MDFNSDSEVDEEVSDDYVQRYYILGKKRAFTCLNIMQLVSSYSWKKMIQNFYSAY